MVGVVAFRQCLSAKLRPLELPNSIGPSLGDVYKVQLHGPHGYGMLDLYSEYFCNDCDMVSHVKTYRRFALS